MSYNKKKCQNRYELYGNKLKKLKIKEIGKCPKFSLKTSQEKQNNYWDIFNEHIRQVTN